MKELFDIFVTPGRQLFGLEQGRTFWDYFFPWLNEKLTVLIQISPEVLTVAAMVCILIGMTGSKKFMGYAGTCILVAFLGVIVCAVI